jgi:glyoxylase-like metal-dependent hydrolase (beta-lactamase superfamily II)
MQPRFPSHYRWVSKLCQAEDMASPLGTLHYFDHNLEVHRVVVGSYANNVFIVRCKHTGDAVLIDAANEHERLLELCTALGVRRVLETHGHHDHIQAVPAMREAGYEVAVMDEDAEMLKDVGYDVFISDTQVFEVGKLRLEAIHNPGHTPGSVSFKIHDAPLLFTGDTLFPGGPGATHFPGSSFETIIESLDTRLFTFPGNTVVLPGHGVDTTISVERPHLNEWIERGW